MLLSHYLMSRMNQYSTPIQLSRMSAGVEKTFFGGESALELRLGMETTAQRMALHEYHSLFALNATLEDLSGSELQDLLDEQLKKMDEARRKGNTKELDAAIALIREILRIMKKRGIPPR